MRHTSRAECAGAKLSSEALLLRKTTNCERRSAFVTNRFGDVNPRPEDILITPRQLELLALYASGYDYDEIAAMKFLSRHTVKNILARASKATGARNLTHLSVICLDAGLIRRNGSASYKPVQEERVISE